MCVLTTKTGDDERFLTFNPNISIDCKKLVRGADINRWTIDFKGEYVIYQPEEMRKNKITARPGTAERFEHPKVLIRDTRWYYETSFPTLHVQRDELASLPIPYVNDTEEIASLADKMLSLNKDLQTKRGRFIRRLKDNLPEVKITGTLETFDTLDFAGFVAELKKQKIKLTLVQQDEWEEYFGQYKTACTELTSAITATDTEIDNRVYELYGLTDGERQVIEA